jgi:serine/threonine protein kinase/WD40 repeat protein
MKPDAPVTGISDDLDPILVDLVEEVKRRVEAGEIIDEAAFLAEHPAQAERLRTLMPAIRGLAGLARSGPSLPAGFADLPDGSDLGDYRVVRAIGRGGMGVVYEAVQRSLGRQVALKVLPPLRGVVRAHLDRFQREAQAAARLHHTNIVPVFGIGEYHGVHFYAMQFIQGRGLDAVVQAARNRAATSTIEMNRPAETPAAPISVPQVPGAVNAGDLSEPGGTRLHRAVALVGVQAAQGLAYAHGQSVLHRDIKPSNLMLDDHGTVWITDFGLARVEGEEALTHSGDMVGTLRYIPPERFAGCADARGDVYALGLTLYELLLRRPAFEENDRARLIEQIQRMEPPTPRQLCPDVPRDLETIILKSMEKEPNRRYAGAQALADDLQRFLDDRPIVARPPRWFERLGKWRRRRPAVAALLSTLLLALVALFSFGTWWTVSLRSALNQKDTALRGKDDALRDKEAALVAKEGERVRADQARSEEQTQRWKVEKERDRAEVAAYQATLNETRALRLGHETGWRARALDNLRRLAVSTAPDKDMVALRSEAVACLAETDLRLLGQPTATQLVGLDISGDGSALAGLHFNGSVTIWELPSLKKLRTIPPTSRGAAPSAFSIYVLPVIRFHPRGDYLVYLSKAGVEVAAWKGKAIERFDLPTEGRHLFFDGDGATLGVACYHGAVQIRDGATGRLREEIGGDRIYYGAVDLHPDGTRLATCRQDGSVILRPISGGEPRVLGRPGAVVTALCFSRDGRRLASAASDGVVRVWDVDSGRERRAWGIVRGMGHGLAFLPDAMALVTSREQVVVRDIRTEEPLARVTSRPVYHLTGPIAVSPDGMTLAVAQSATSTRQPTALAVYRLEGRRERQLVGGDGQKVTGVAFHPRQSLVGVAGDLHDPNISMWDLSAGAVLRRWKGEPAHAQPLVFSPDGALIAGPLEKDIRLWKCDLGIWDAATGELQHRVRCKVLYDKYHFDAAGQNIILVPNSFVDTVASVAIVAGQTDLIAQPGGRLLAYDIALVDGGKKWLVTRLPNGPLGLVDAASSEELAQTSGTFSAVAPDGNHAVVVHNTALRLVSLPGLRELSKLEVRRELVGPRAFNHDGRWLVALAGDKLHVRDSRTLALRLVLPMPERGATHADVSPRDELAVWGGETTATVYDLALLRRELAELGLDWRDNE